MDTPDFRLRRLRDRTRWWPAHQTVTQTRSRSAVGRCQSQTTQTWPGFRNVPPRWNSCQRWITAEHGQRGRM